MLFATRRYQITTLTILSVLAFSTFIPALAYAQPLAASDKDWQYIGGNSWGWRYGPQTQINKDNVDQLEVKWVFPVGSKSLAPAGLQSLALADGTTTPPIVANGLVYITTNFFKTYAVDAKTGKEVWTHDYTIDIETLQERLPWVPHGFISHLHGIRYWESGDAVLYTGMACDLVAVDGKTGEEKVRINDLCLNIPGSLYVYRPNGASQNNVGTYEKGRQFIFTIHGNTGGWTKQGRHVTMGIDMDTHQVLWRVFSQPPQDKTAKDWALEECDIGFFLDIPCTEVLAQNRAGLEWDWAMPGEPPSPYGGVSASWGQPVVDEDTGLLYINTGNQSPYSNLTFTPGPRLYGSAIMAIDLNQGKRVWWVQVFPHDPYDLDCNWSGILAEHPTLGKMYMKGCKEGFLNILNAATGEPIHRIDVVEEQYPGMKTYHLTDPFSYYDLREWNWPENSRYHGEGPIIVIPPIAHGAFGTDMTYDPETQTLYHYVSMMPGYYGTRPFQEGGPANTFGATVCPCNVTIVARDITTGDVKWTWLYRISNQRSQMAVSGGMLFTGFTDGTVKFFNKDTGEFLNEVNLGSPIVTGVTVGKDSDGDSKIFVVGGASSFIAAGPGYGNPGPQVPGTVIALGLSGRAAAEVKTTTVTTTTTSRTTLTTTTTSVSTTTATTTQTVTSTTTRVSTTTATSTTTLATTSTVISTAAPSTTTVTSEITETTGLPATVTYAAVAVAVIAIIAAAVLATRRRA